MKAMKIQDDIPSISVDNIGNHYVLMLGLTSMEVATKNCHHSGLVGKPLRREVTLFMLWKMLLNSLFWENECLWMQLTVFEVVGKGISNR